MGITPEEFRRLAGVANQPPMLMANGRPVRQPLPVPTEKDVQAAIVKALQIAGYTVLETSQRRASGVSLGLPDLLVTRNGWPVLVGLEVKRDGKAKASPEQQTLVDSGCVHIVWTPQMALDVVRRLG